MRWLLQNYGYEVLIARNGLEAVELFKSEKANIRLVITDTDMPILNGIEASNEIYKMNPKIPVIIASGMPTKVVGIVGELNGFTLSKPYSVEQLLEVVNSVLKGTSPSASETKQAMA